VLLPRKWVVGRLLASVIEAAGVRVARSQAFYRNGVIRSGTGQSVRSQLPLSRVDPNGLWSKRRVRNIVLMVR